MVLLLNPVLKPITVDGDPVDKLKHVAIVDEDDNRVLAIATKNYKLIKHSSVIAMCEDAFQKYGRYELTAEYYGNHGARLFRSYIFPDCKHEINKKDFIHPAILVQNSYDLSFGVNIDLRGYRESCANDLPTAESVFSLTSKHTTGINLSKIKKSLYNAVSSFEKQVENWREWRNIELAKREIKTCVDFVFLQKSLREEAYSMLRRFDFVNKQYSRWDLFMLLTNIATHKLDLQKSRIVQRRILTAVTTPHA